MSTIVTIFISITAIATGVIAYYAWQSHLLSKKLNKFTITLITSTLILVEKITHTKVDVKYFDDELKKVEKYFKDSQQ